MKAVVASAYGSPDVLQIHEIETPTPKPNEVLVQVHATTVTPGDCRVRSFDVPPMFWVPGRLALGWRKPKNPIFGFELAGEVVAVGDQVTRFNVGDQIFASSNPMSGGAYAEYICLPEDGVLANKPHNLTYDEAAAIPYGGRTALHFLRESHIQSGQSILIYGASGSVGTYAVQLARYFGAVVTAVCSGANVELVKSLGAHQVIDYTQEDFTQNGETYDIVFDAVGKTTFAQCKGSIKPHGTYLHVVMVLDKVKARWYKMTTGRHVVGGSIPAQAEALIFLKELAEADEVKPVIDREYPLEQIVEAHRYVDTGRKKGNVIVSMRR